MGAAHRVSSQAHNPRIYVVSALPRGRARCLARRQAALPPGPTFPTEQLPAGQRDPFTTAAEGTVSRKCTAGIFHNASAFN